MIGSALVCVDGSSSGQAALNLARDCAQRLNLKLKVLLVEGAKLTAGQLVACGADVETDNPGFRSTLMARANKQVDTALAGARQTLEGLTSPVEFVQRAGLVDDVILEEARTVELVCLGHREEDGDAYGGNLGWSTYKVLRRSSRPCLVMPARFLPLGKILAAYDGSLPAARALRQACELAEGLRLPLAVVTVAPAAESLPKYLGLLTEARQLIEAHSGVKCEFELLVGEKTELLIARHAAGRRARLIVMGAHGRSRVRQGRLGSTTTGVLVSADLPVLLVP